MSALSAFNKTLVDFFEDMADTYPEEKDIRQASDGLKTLRKMNPKLIHKTFMEAVYTEFKEPILNKNEDLLVKRAHEILNSPGYSDISYAFWIFDKHWKTMSEANKNHVWKYCQALILLAEKAQG